MTIRIAVVSAGLSVPSSTRLLADQLADSAAGQLRAAGQDVQVDVVELRPLAHALADHLLTGFATGELATALRAVRDADALVAVTPVFSASYSGLFKQFFDVVEQGALDGTPVLMAATAGTARHSLVLEHALRPLFAHLRAVPVPTAVFAASEDFGSGDIGGGAGGQLGERVRRAAGELVALLGAAGTGPAAPRDVVRRDVMPASDEEFPDPRPFEDLLAG